MIALSPVPLWFRLSEASRKALRDYQTEVWELNLEIPHYDAKPAFFQPIILTTEEASRLMKMTRRHFK